MANRFRANSIYLSGQSVTASGNSLFINNNLIGGGAGEANTASNIGLGSGLFAQKSAVDLQFKSLSPGTGILITGDANSLTVLSKTVIKQTEIDFGSTGVSEASFTIIDSFVTASSNIIANLAYIAPTNKDLDETEMDNLEIRCGPSGGGFLIYVTTDDGSYIHDKFVISYMVGI